MGNLNWLVFCGLTNKNTEHLGAICQSSVITERTAYCKSAVCNRFTREIFDEKKGIYKLKTFYRPKTEKNNLGRVTMECPDCGSMLFWRTKQIIKTV